ncbi:hypothetical protein ACEQPO_14295 [Bacillus sp. SL00103]
MLNSQMALLALSRALSLWLAIHFTFYMLSLTLNIIPLSMSYASMVWGWYSPHGYFWRAFSKKP